MKIKSIFKMSIVTLCMMACGENRDMETGADIAGTYEGYTIANCVYMQDMCTESEKISITANADGSANITFLSDTWGEFIISNVQMNENGGVYTLSGNGQTEMGMGGNVSSYDCTFTAVIKNPADAKMQFSVPGVMGGLTIDFVTGEASEDLE